MAGRLYIVATPIGNLEDITVRALRVLGEVDLIAAEDTRRTRGLLAHFGIGTPMLSFHAHSPRSRLSQIVSRVEAGQRVAVVSDAGTPLVSDPGRDLVQACVEAGLAVEAVPGVSAPLALAMVAGFEVLPWTVLGFPPHGSKDLGDWLNFVVSTPHCVSFLEAPHRIAATLKRLKQVCGTRPIVVGREITKLHEQLYRGTVAEVEAAGVVARGELTVMLGPVVPVPDHTAAVQSDDDLLHELGHMTDKNGSRRALVREIAKKHGLSTKYVYAAIERAKSG